MSSGAEAGPDGRPAPVPAPVSAPVPLSLAEGVGHGYRVGRRLKTVLSGVTLPITSGATVGLVGESGSGKSTLARLMLGLERPSEGRVLFRGQPMPRPFSDPWKRMRPSLQMVFQDPYAALDRRLGVLEQVAEPLVIHRLAGRSEALERARATLAKVSFPAGRLGSKPGSLSGGQLQRVVIARAVVLGPELLICDEPLSSLDVSIQAQVLSLLSDLKNASGMAMLFVSHDLNVVRYIADRFAVMHRGRLVETGPVDRLDRPAHPYTELLLASAPGSTRPPVPVPARIAPPPGGCAFAARCHKLMEACLGVVPPLVDAGTGSMAACLLARGL